MQGSKRVRDLHNAPKEVDPDWDIHQRAGMDAIGNTRWAKGTPRRGRQEPKEQAAGMPVGELSHSSV